MNNISLSRTGSSRTNWHHPRERPSFDGERDRPREFSRPGENRERRFSGRNRQDSWHEDTTNEEMPEWTMDDDPFDLDSIGTFDSSGAFCALKVFNFENSNIFAL